MREHECAFEPEVLDAVRTGRWPHRCEVSLVSHARTCAVCADLAEVAAAMNEAVEQEGDVPPLPLPAAIWWRAQRQARIEAARSASLPLRLAQAAALACAIALAAGFGGAVLATLGGISTDGFARIAERLGSLLPAVLALPSLDTLSVPARAALLLGGIAVGVLAPAALYVGLADPSRHDRAR